MTYDRSAALARLREELKRLHFTGYCARKLSTSIQTAEL